MDEFVGQNAIDKKTIPRRGSSLSFRGSSHEERNMRIRSRLGFNTQQNPMKRRNDVNLEKANYSKPFLCTSSRNIASSSSSSGKAAVEIQNSSKSLAGKHLHQEQKNQSLKDTISTKTSSAQVELEALEGISSSRGIHIGQSTAESIDSVVSHGLYVNPAEELGCSAHQKKLTPSTVSNYDASIGSIRRSFSSKNVYQTIKSRNERIESFNASIGCASPSISDLFPSGSFSDYSQRRIDVLKGRYPSNGENFVARGKKAAGFSSGSSSQRNIFSGNNSSTANHSIWQMASRRMRNCSSGSINIATTAQGDTNTMLPNSNCDTTSPIPENDTAPPLSQAEFPADESDRARSRTFTTELPSIRRDPFRRPRSGNETFHGGYIGFIEDNGTQTFPSFSLHQRDGSQRFNMEGIAEMLLVLERIEHNELTYEQLLALESNLLDGLRFHDPHRDMRLDIDNMSYEELLALEERMGTVSTALTEDQLSKCLERNYYSTPLTSGIMGQRNDDAKCSICQEEFMVGDEMGKVGCEHQYHLECIQQWLRQKNWCPVCKASAAQFCASSPKPFSG